MTQYPDIFAALAAPFDPNEVRVRTQAGRQLHYITARTAMNRLDDVLGPENWWDHYEAAENSVKCVLTVRLPSGECLAKQDAGGYAGMADSGDDDKSGFSDAFKRAAVKFGIARYLYRDGVPQFVREREPGAAAAPAGQPSPPSDAHAAASQSRPAPTDGGHHTPHNGQGGQDRAPTNGQGGGRDRAPTTGRALFAWTKEREQRHEVGLLKYVSTWAKLQDFPDRMVDFTPDQVRLAHQEIVRKLESITGGGHGDSYEEALSN